MQKRIADLEVGDLVDLENDKFADPKGEHSEFEFSYQLVEAIDVETPNCIAVWFDGFDCVGFPPEHKVTVCEDQS